MKRREFLALLGAAAACPHAARAQPAAMPIVGFLHPGSPQASLSVAAGFLKGLGEAGYIEGRNIAIEYRWAEGREDLLPQLAADLVRRRVAVIVTPTSTNAALAAKAATTTIPIVFSIGLDPVRLRLVASLNRPGGNVTGITSMNLELIGKRIELLRELLPDAARFAVMVNPNNPISEFLIADARAAVQTINGQMEVLNAGTPRDIEVAFETLGQKKADALVVAPGTPFTERRVQIATLATRHAVPAIYATREWIDAGGLMSYGPVLGDEFRDVGTYTGRILKGDKPAELPVQRPTKFELGLNLQTARAIRIVVPPTLLARADEVIE
jgi:putative tryptophan/tyrosine transport system substrate-binding protein